MDRRKQGLKRSILTDAGAIPLAALPALANRRDDGLLAATLDAVGLLGLLPQRPTVHLDAGYDYQPCRQVLCERGMVVHRTPQGGGRVLAGAGQRRHRLRPTGPPRLGLLSLG